MKKLQTLKGLMGNHNYHHGDLASALIEAAETELVEKGVADFSLRAVAKRAGVSHGAPAHHFKDKTGLITSLATVGYCRLVVAQNERQKNVEANPRSQLIASGLGYLDFAEKNPTLFRLMFSSEKPNRSNEDFASASMAAFNKLVYDVKQFLGADPYADRVAMQQVMKSWSMVHGLAELVISGRAEIPMNLSGLSSEQRDIVFTEVISRAII